MGIIKKQAIQSSFWSYAGVALGFLNLGILAPRFFTTEEVGLTQVLVSFAAILSQLGTLGMGNVAMRMFPAFRNENNKHNGFIGLAMVVGLLGFLIMALATGIMQPYFISTNIEKSSLLVEHFNYIYPLIFFMLFFSLFDYYNCMLFNAVLGVFLKDFLLRVLNTLCIFAYFFRLISFDTFVLLYVISMAVPTVILGIVLMVRKQLTLKVDFGFLNRKVRIEMADVAIFGIIGGLSSIILQNLDRLMVNQYIGLEAAGVYSVTFFFGTLILIPQRAIANISTIIVSEAWKNNDLKTISDIYYKSSINQFIIGLLLFVGIWGNIDNVFLLLGSDYTQGKWVIFFISLGNLASVLSGGAIFILATSKYYRYHMWLMVFLIALVLVTNLIFIPLWGLTGAAFASFISLVGYNLCVCAIIYRTYKIQPISRKHIGVLIAGMVAYFISTVIPQIDSFIFDIALRSVVIISVYGVIIFVLQSSDDFSGVVKLLYKKLTKN